MLMIVIRQTYSSTLSCPRQSSLIVPIAVNVFAFAGDTPMIRTRTTVPSFIFTNPSSDAQQSPCGIILCHIKVFEVVLVDYGRLW